MSKQTNDRKAVLAYIGSALVFGTIGVFRRYIPVSSAFLSFTRGILGGLFVMAYTRITDKGSVRSIPRRQLLWLIISGAVMGVNWMLLFEAYNHTTVAIATLCYYMQPTILILLSPVLFKEKLTRKKALCAAVAVIGMVLVSGVIGGTGTQGNSLYGVLLGLLAACFYAGVIIINKKLTGLDPYPKTMVQLLSAGITMVPYMLLTNSFDAFPSDPKALIPLLIVGLVHTGITYVIYFGSMEHLRTQTVAILGYIDPVSALFFSALLLKEPLSLYNIIGAILIIGSALISEL